MGIDLFRGLVNKIEVIILIALISSFLITSPRLRSPFENLATMPLGYISKLTNSRSELVTLSSSKNSDPSK